MRLWLQIYISQIGKLRFLEVKKLASGSTKLNSKAGLADPVCILINHGTLYNFSWKKIKTWAWPESSASLEQCLWRGMGNHMEEIAGVKARRWESGGHVEKVKEVCVQPSTCMTVLWTSKPVCSPALYLCVLPYLLGLTFCFSPPLSFSRSPWPTMSPALLPFYIASAAARGSPAVTLSNFTLTCSWKYS